MFKIKTIEEQKIFIRLIQMIFIIMAIIIAITFGVQSCLSFLYISIFIICIFITIIGVTWIGLAIYLKDDKKNEYLGNAISCFIIVLIIFLLYKFGLM